MSGTRTESTEEEGDWAQLSETLATHPVESEAVLNALRMIWPERADTAMFSHKLERWEGPKWKYPRLTFNVERHGAAVMGSTRAEVQTWAVDVERRTIEIEGTTWRQLHKASPRLDVRPLAERCLDEMNAGPDSGSEWLKWVKHDHVRVNVASIIPATYQQTTTDRRRRFRKALAAAAAASDDGWHEIRRDNWVRNSS